jgi:Flp pilus assembly protein TadG
MTRPLPPFPISDRRGMALVEFALLLPVMLTLFLGGYQLTQASACQRRVTIVARAIADLVSQYETIDVAGVKTILDASAQILIPYDVSKAQSRVSLIRVNAAKKVTVVWSEGSNMTPRPTGNFTALPQAMRIADSYYVFSEVTYDYSPTGGRYSWPLTFTQSMYMVPRKSAAVDCPTC